MALNLPPPPLKAQQDNFAWQDWYNKLYKQLTSTGTIAWNQIDFTGSSLADLQTRPHGALTGVQGGVVGERYHVSLAVYNNITGLPPAANLLVSTGSYSNPSWITSLDYNKLTGTPAISGGTINGTVIGATTPANATVVNLEATGSVKFGSYTAASGLTITGYITITDAGGTSRRLAVV